MKIDYYKYASWFTFIVMILLLCTACYTSIRICITETPLEFSPNKAGFQLFFNIFDIPIKLSVAAFAVFAGWVTLGRVTQTERQLTQTIRQLEVMSDNNKFNNYYKHIDEFIKFMEKDILFSMLSKIKMLIDTRSILLPLYKRYYYVLYKDFVPCINQATKDYTTSLLTTIRSSVFNVPNTDFSTLKLAQIEPLAEQIDETIKTLVEPIIEQSAPHIHSYLLTLQMSPSQIQTELEKFRLISIVYWASSFYTTLLMFEGIEHQISEPFSINYGEYIDFLGQHE